MLGWLVSSVWKCVGMTVNADDTENSRVMFCHNKQRPLKKDYAFGTSFRTLAAFLLLYSFFSFFSFLSFCTYSEYTTPMRSGYDDIKHAEKVS